MQCSLRFKFSVLIFCLLFLGIGFLAANAAEEDKPADSTAAVPDTVNRVKMALEEFHKILVPLWHESFAQKDFKTIREKAPLLNEKLMILLRVQPPAELQQDEEKFIDFMGKRQELAFQVTQVNLAAKDGPDSTLASAFEKMHWAYEEVDKVFAEPIKELDSFHETLYLLWHKALPERDYKTIRETAPVLKAEADSLVKVTLPQGCKVKKEEFDKKATALKDAVYRFADKSENGTEEEIDQSLKTLHDRFAELNMLLR